MSENAANVCEGVSGDVCVEESVSVLFQIPLLRGSVYPVYGKNTNFMKQD